MRPSLIYTSITASFVVLLSHASLTTAMGSIIAARASQSVGAVATASRASAIASRSASASRSVFSSARTSLSPHRSTAGRLSLSPRITSPRPTLMHAQAGVLSPGSGARLHPIVRQSPPALIPAFKGSKVSGSGSISPGTSAIPKTAVVNFGSKSTSIAASSESSTSASKSTSNAASSKSSTSASKSTSNAAASKSASKKASATQKGGMKTWHKVALTGAAGVAGIGLIGALSKSGGDADEEETPGPATPSGGTPTPENFDFMMDTQGAIPDAWRNVN